MLLSVFNPDTNRDRKRKPKPSLGWKGPQRHFLLDQVVPCPVQLCWGISRGGEKSRMQWQKSIYIPCQASKSHQCTPAFQGCFPALWREAGSRHKGCENPALESSLCFTRTKQNLIRAGWKSFFLCKSSSHAKQIFHQNGKDIRNFSNEVDAVIWNVLFKKNPTKMLLWGRWSDAVTYSFGCQQNSFYPENCSRNGAFPGVAGWWMDVLCENHWKFGDKFKLETSSAGTAVDQFTLVLSTQQPPVT